MTPSPRTGTDWSVAGPLLAVHALGLGLAPLTASAPGAAALAVGYVLTGFGVTVGAHRLFAHRAFRPHPLVREALALLFLLAAQGSVHRWVRDHALHHRYSDGDGDPHSPRDGALHAHFGWLWGAPPSPAEARALYERTCAGLDAGAVGRFFRAPLRLALLHLGVIGVVGGTGLALGGPPLAASLVVWGVLLRIVLVMHSTFLVNSACHLWGARPYPSGDTSRNLAWVALLALGEGWHNNHHHRPAAANNGFHHLWQLDPSFLVILLLGGLGLASDVRVWRADPGRLETWWPSREGSA